MADETRGDVPRSEDEGKQPGNGDTPEGVGEASDATAVMDPDATAVMGWDGAPDRIDTVRAAGVMPDEEDYSAAGPGDTLVMSPGGPPADAGMEPGDEPPGGLPAWAWATLAVLVLVVLVAAMAVALTGGEDGETPPIDTATTITIPEESTAPETTSAKTTTTKSTSTTSTTTSTTTTSTSTTTTSSTTLPENGE